MKTIGIVAHSAEGGALCFLTACRVGQELLGPHLHPEIVVSAVPLAWSMPGWESGDHDVVAQQLRRANLDDLCLGRFEPATTGLFERTIAELAADGAGVARRRRVG